MVRPAMAYGSTSWPLPLGIKDAQKGTVEKLAIKQIKCLKVMAGAYKATPIEVLHAETLMPPMEQYFDEKGSG